MAVLGDERNPGPEEVDGRGPLYSFAITTGVRLRPVMRGGTLPIRKTIASTLLLPPILYISGSRADTHVNWNMIKRASNISLPRN